ncbi:MAG TPA: BatD family protein [Candidatus Krumholzibacteria bacterium]
MIRTMTWLVLGLLCVGGTRAFADDVTVRASIDPTTVEVGGQAMLTIEVEGKFRRSASPLLPPLDDFEKYEAGTSQNFSFVNGQVHSSITYNYILSPRREGTFKIEPIRFQIGDKQYTANSVELTVVAAQPGVNVPPSSATPSRAPSSRRASDLPGEDESIFVAATVDRDTVYVNQQITWTLGYYTDGRVELLRSPNYSPPSSEGFWVEDLPPQNKFYTTLHGRQFLVSEIKRAYFPAAPGTYSIGEARVDIVVDDLGRGDINDFLSRGMRGGFGQSRTLTTKELQVVVKALPAAGKPAGFAGAVASNLAVTMTADKQNAHVGEPINITVEINGTGNMRTLSAPKLTGIEKFKSYESGNSTDSFKNDYVVSGKRKFQYVIVPQVEGEFTIPPVEIAYFDPAKRSYRVAQSAPAAVHVDPGTKEDGRKIVYAGGGDDFEVLNRDIRFIHPAPASLAMPGAPFYQRSWFMAAQAAPLLLLAGAMVVERRRRRLREDIGFARASRALREADRRLVEADSAFRAGKTEQGFAAMHTAVVGYFADRANVPPASLSSETIATWLESKHADPARIDTVRRVIGACDMARYAAATARADDGRELAKSARESLAAIEREIA